MSCSGPCMCRVPHCDCLRREAKKLPFLTVYEVVVCECCERRLSEKERRFFRGEYLPRTAEGTNYTVDRWQVDVARLLDALGVDLKFERELQKSGGSK